DGEVGLDRHHAPVRREILRVLGCYYLHRLLQAALVAIGARLARWPFRRPHGQAVLRQEDRRVVSRVEVVAPIESDARTGVGVPSGVLLRRRDEWRASLQGLEKR